MRRLLGLAAVVGVAVVAASPASATPRECRGLQVCVPVTGPWVAVHATSVQFLLSCPRGYIVGGTDAELSDRAIAVRLKHLKRSGRNPASVT